MLDDIIWRYCVRKTDLWNRADYNPPIWWTYVAAPAGWLVDRYLDRVERRFIRDLDRWGR